MRSWAPWCRSPVGFPQLLFKNRGNYGHKNMQLMENGSPFLEFLGRESIVVNDMQTYHPLFLNSKLWKNALFHDVWYLTLPVLFWYFLPSSAWLLLLWTVHLSSWTWVLQPHNAGTLLCCFVLLLLPKLGQGLPWWSSPVVNTLFFLCTGCWLIPGQGTKIQHAKKKQKKNQTSKSWGSAPLLPISFQRFLWTTSLGTREFRA